MTASVDVTTHITIAAPRQTCFEYIVPVSLSHIFHPYLFIPGVVRTDEFARWVTPGLSRTVYFTDGARATESLQTVESPESFSYEITAFTGINKFLVTSINGTWQFSENTAGGTDIKWRYSLNCRNILTEWIARFFVAPALRAFLQRALQVLKVDLEKGGK